jgi:hypothetical protein
MRATGFDTVEWLRPEALTAEERTAPLATLGVAAGDVLGVERHGVVTHHQLGQIGGPR